MERLTDENIFAIKVLANHGLENAKRKSDEILFKTIADAVAEIEHLRAEQAQEPFTVKVLIPSLNPQGACSEICPLFYNEYCKNGWLIRDYETPNHRVLLKPGPLCPRYEEGK